jgi:signal transduction histidine kinase
VFDRFRQADSGTTRHYGGGGRGRAIVHDHVPRHGGAITAASAGAGRGAAFTILLPATGDAGLQPTSAATPTRVPRKPKRR